MTRHPTPHAAEAASSWVRRWVHLLADHTTVLDVACGWGRHMRLLAELGHTAVGVDRDAQAIAAATAFGQAIQADIEEMPWPFQGRQFGGVVVTNYLWRALWPQIMGSLAPGGVLIYETFAAGNESVGKPSRPDFLLQPGELLARCSSLRVVAFEEGFLKSPERFVQRIVAVNSSNTQATRTRFDLNPSLQSLE